jgi:EpsI family protein
MKMNANRRAYVASGLMLLGVATAKALTPKTRRSDVLGPLDLAAAVPINFGNWQVDKNAARMIVDPQTQATIDRTYTQTLSRVYVNTSTGQRIMLSLAYGAELTDTGVGLHYPEVCYPAQGFKVTSTAPVILTFPQGSIKARQLETVYGDNRFEPVTYWTMIGPKTEYAGVDRKMAEIKMGLLGEKPDGLLFRISSISKKSAPAFELQKSFIEALLAATTPTSRARLTGLN